MSNLHLDKDKIIYTVYFKKVNQTHGKKKRMTLAQT